jgi:anti-anti-sigma regulatory factor
LGVLCSDVTGAEPPTGDAGPADGDLRISSLHRRVGLRLDGEVDMLTVASLERALSGLAGVDGDVHLELAGLRFIDLSGAAALAAFAASLGRGRRLLLQDPPVMLRRMIKLLWPQQPGLTMSPP